MPSFGSMAEMWAKRLIVGATREGKYFCRFKAYVEEFEHCKTMLDAKRIRVLMDAEEARRNGTQVSHEVQSWLEEAYETLQEDTKTMKKCVFGWCPNCIWQYRQGRKLEKRTWKIKDLIGRSNFYGMALRVNKLPDIEYFSSNDFFHFESRKQELEKLVKALEDENCSMIGLYGMGGTGKTTLAREVGKEVQNRRAFERVIFVVVSSPPDVRKIQFNIANQLSLELGEREEEVISTILWKRIAINDEKVLIILDDMWEELDLRKIGIPYGPNHRNCCVLITTRHLRVCIGMRCQRTIGLQTLSDQDAVNLFVKHVGISSDDSSNELMGLARKIIQACEGLPISVVAIANTLKSWPLQDWKIALDTLQLSQTLHDVDEDMTEVYISLRLSYDRLNERAKYVFLLCALFPEGYVIPVDLLCKLTIGLGLFEGVDKYSLARSMVIREKYDLISSSLLLEAKEVHVKMHSMVREMALWVSNTDLQVIMDSRTPIKSGMKFLYWSTDDFPKQLDGTRLEILVLWMKGKVRVEDSYTIFEKMSKLKVLFLHCDDGDHQYVPLSLKLLSPLKDIRTLILYGWQLGDMSVLKNLHGIEIIELTYCLINELPNEISELKNLRSLGLRKCKIQRNNPFEVIERCIHLEELDFVLNSNIEDWKEEGERENKDKFVPDVSPPPLARYTIACPHLKYFDHDDNGMLNCFNTENVRNLVSNAMFQNIVRTAKVLELGEMRSGGWKSLVPDMIPMEDGGMKDLIKLALYSLDDMECLVNINHHHFSDVAVFSKLVELHLDGMDYVIELYRGPRISGFLGSLQILKLQNCKRLRNVFFDSNLKLHSLKVLHLINCPIMFQSSIFESSVAQSLVQLEELLISDFEELKRIITYESLEEEMVDVEYKNSYSKLFPSLKTLEIKGCGKLELISPVLYSEDLPLLEAIIIRKCEELKYIFDKCRRYEEGRVLHDEIILPSLTKMLLDDVPNFISLFKECSIDMQVPPAPILKDDSEEKFSSRAAFSWARVCCFRPIISDTDIVVSNSTLQDHKISPELPVSMKGIQTFHTAKCLLGRPLEPQNIREMTIVHCPKLMTLFSVSTSTATLMLEKLTIQKCDKLRHVITNDEEDHVHIDYITIFPKLEELLIVDCKNMESIFPPTSGNLQNLKFVIIRNAPELKYIFGRFGHENKKLYIDFPALETLSLTDTPSIISICSNGSPLNLETAKELPASMKGIQTFHTAQCLLRQTLTLTSVRQMTIGQCSNLVSLFTLSNAKTAVMLEKLTIQSCDKLKHLMTNEEEEEDDGYHMDGISIFPKLEELLIFDCRNMEFIFPSTSSVLLRKLKFVIIRAAPKLKHVFGRFGREEYLPNEDENKDLYIDLPSLETISLTNVPNLIGINANGRQLSLGTAKNLISQGGKESEIVETTDVGRPVISSVSTDVLNFHNLREIKIIENRKIKTTFPVSSWRSLSQLSELCILNCEELVHLVDENSKDYGHFIDNYILPNLEYLQIQNCNKLEFIFPSSFLGGFPKLKSMIVEKASDLKYIFGKYHEGDYLSNDNESGEFEFEFDLPYLETLSIRDVPNIINICARRYSLLLPSLQQIGLDKCQELAKDSPDLTVYWKPAEDLVKICRLTNLEVGNSTIDEFFNFEGAKIEGQVTLSLQAMVLKNLRELKQICKCPNKSTLSFYYLRSLKVIGCKRLRTIFSISIMKSLPNLFHLKIKDCEELIHIIEEDPEEIAGDDSLQLSFPRLEKIHIKSCDSLKFLFSISTPNMFPKLERLEIEEACELEKIFTGKKDNTSKIMVMNDEFPSLSYLRLIKLPKLVTIGWKIRFQTSTDHQVVDCPKYQEITSRQDQQEPEILDLDNQAATDEPLSPHFNHIQDVSHMRETSSLADSAENDRKAMNKSVEGVPISNKSSESTGKKLKEIEAQEPTPALEKQEFETSTAKPLPRRASVHELKDVQATKESIGQLQHQDPGEKKKLIGVPEKTNVPLDDDSTDAISKERVQQVHISEDEEDLKKTKPRSEPILTHQQEQGGSSACVIENIPREMAMMEPKLHASSIDSEAGSSQSGPCKIIDKETGKEIDKAVPTSKLPTAKTSQDSQVDSLKETSELGFQEHDKSKKNITSIQPPLAKEVSQNSEAGKQIEGISIASEASIIPTSSNSKVDSVKETMGQSFQDHDASSEATILETQSADLEPGKQSKSSKTGEEAGGMLVTSQSSMSTTSTNSESTKGAERETVDTSSRGATPFDSTVEQTGHASVEEEQKLENSSKLNLPNVISSLNHQSSQIGTASPSPASEILEIFDLAELKDGEAALLARALKQYPQLVLPREQRTQRRIAFSYRVLVDILVMLANKTPCTITTSEKSTLDDNLCEATSLGFNKGWVDSVRAKVFDIDMPDVLSAQEKIRAMEAELQTYDMMLKQVQKEKQEAGRQVEIAQSWFDAIDSKLSSLLKDRNTLKANMTKLKNIISAKDTPFGI